MKGVPSFPAVAYERIICIRHLVRAKRKAGENCSKLLELSYENAGQNDAICVEPAIALTKTFLGESEPRTYPGYNAAKILHALAGRHGLLLNHKVTRTTVGFKTTVGDSVGSPISSSVLVTAVDAAAGGSCSSMDSL